MFCIIFITSLCKMPRPSILQRACCNSNIYLAIYIIGNFINYQSIHLQSRDY
nr:MAG TPA: hypothetical protein [Caudoviricetes sp.]DAV02937.1 MAG TPA: hypothetical protein [Bacteriophage sp.]